MVPPEINCVRTNTRPGSIMFVKETRNPIVETRQSLLGRNIGRHSIHLRVASIVSDNTFKSVKLPSNISSASASAVPGRRYIDTWWAPLLKSIEHSVPPELSHAASSLSELSLVWRILFLDAPLVDWSFASLAKMCMSAAIPCFFLNVYFFFQRSKWNGTKRTKPLLLKIMSVKDLPFVPSVTGAKCRCSRSCS